METKTIAELLESAGEKPATCPYCGCRDLRRLRFTEADVHRRLVCRHCGRLVVELVRYTPKTRAKK
jgi:transcription initiation factor TFIIIB Brf1 subunit/transcription initiation factor TFIIB